MQNFEKFVLNQRGNNPFEFVGREFCVTELSQKNEGQRVDERVAVYIRRDGKVVLECATLDKNQMLFESVTVHETLEAAVDFLATLPLSKNLYEQSFEDLASRGLYGTRGANN